MISHEPLILFDHPSYSLVNRGPLERNLRKYAGREYKENIESFIPRGGLNQANLKLGMKSIHTVDVRSAINSYSTNPITANRHPPIDGSEQELPRRTRATLEQLRSRWCHIPKHYMSRINHEIQDICPNCGTSPHYVHHLFNCPRKPTTLEITSLWTNPIEAEIFLYLDTEENDDETTIRSRGKKSK